MKRLLVPVVACLILVLTLNVTGAAYAQPTGLSWIPSLHLADTSTQLHQDLMTQLESEILPKLESIFTPDQREQFKMNVANGTSFRKAFKSLMLTPAQKTELKTLLKSVPKKDALASLTPEQKKQLFLKKKEMFMPTSEAITDKINTGMKSKGVSLPEGVKEKIDAAMKKKDAFMPTAESITEKINAGMNKLKDEMKD